MNPDDANPLIAVGLASELRGTDCKAIASLAVVLSFSASETIFCEGEKHPFVY